MSTAVLHLPPPSDPICIARLMLEHPAARPYEVARACETLRRYGTPGDHAIATTRYERLRAELAAIPADPMLAIPATSPAGPRHAPAGAIHPAHTRLLRIAAGAERASTIAALAVTTFATGWILAALFT